MLFVVMDGVNQEHPDRFAESPATVLCHQDWLMLFVVMVDANQEPPERVAEPPATVLCHEDWIMLFVVKGRASVVYAKIIVVTTVIVLQDYSVRVILVFQNVMIA